MCETGSEDGGAVWREKTGLRRSTRSGGGTLVSEQAMVEWLRLVSLATLSNGYPAFSHVLSRSDRNKRRCSESRRRVDGIPLVKEQSRGRTDLGLARLMAFPKLKPWPNIQSDSRMCGVTEISRLR